MTRFFNVTRFFSLTLVFLCFGALCVQAGPNVVVTEQERAVFSFFKLAKTTPDYKSWIESSDIYKKAESKEKREEIFEQESLRLKWGFGTHEVEENLLKIRTNVLLQLQEGEQGKTLNFKFTNLGNKYIPYFPYAYGKELVSLIIDDLEKFVTVPLTDEEFKAVNAYLKTGTVYNGNLRMRIRPLHVDHNKPINMDGLNQWLMLGDTAYLEFSYNDPQSEEQQRIWEYAAPWYLSTSESTLLQLLEE